MFWTMIRFKDDKKSSSFKFHAGVLNQLWQRILQESNNLKVSCQQKVDEIVDTIIGVYVEENIKQEGMTS